MDKTIGIAKVNFRFDLLPKFHFVWFILKIYQFFVIIVQLFIFKFFNSEDKKKVQK